MRDNEQEKPFWQKALNCVLSIRLVFLQKGDIVVVPTKTITNVSRYFRDVQTTLSPFVAGTAIYRNATTGGAQGTSSVLD